MVIDAILSVKVKVLIYYLLKVDRVVTLILYMISLKKKMRERKERKEDMNTHIQLHRFGIYLLGISYTLQAAIHKNS